MNPIFTSLIYLIVSCSMLIFSKWLFMRFAKYNMYEEIKKGNVTGIIPYLGFLLGVCAIQIGAFVGPSNTLFRYEILSYIMYSLMGSFLMIFSGYVVEKAILHKFSNVDEIVRDRNIGTAAVHFGMYLASGLIISACVTGETIVAHGRCYGVISTLIYYVMGMIFLILFAKLYDMLTPYSLLGEIEADNVAVGWFAELDARGGIIVEHDTNISSHVKIITGSHDIDDSDYTADFKPVHVGHHCWIGTGAVILQNVSIGDGAVVAAGAVVTKDIPAGEVWGGVPAKYIRKRNCELNYKIGAPPILH